MFVYPFFSLLNVVHIERRIFLNLTLKRIFLNLYDLIAFPTVITKIEKNLLMIKEKFCWGLAFCFYTMDE
jgi:hypothetical protein